MGKLIINKASGQQYAISSKGLGEIKCYTQTF